MKTYILTVETTVEERYEVEAESPEDAKDVFYNEPFEPFDAQTVSAVVCKVEEA